jgi:hypothetical protein
MIDDIACSIVEDQIIRIITICQIYNFALAKSANLSVSMRNRDAFALTEERDTHGWARPVRGIL